MPPVDAPDRTVASNDYLLDNRAPEAEQRFDSLAALFNPGIFRHMERLGVAEGWTAGRSAWVAG